MGVLRTVESKLEGLVEGVFSRAFRARVQPVELARRLAKEMESYKTVSVSRTYVPNEYIVFLSREDRRQFEGYEPALLDELSAHLLEHAAREGLALLTRPKVSFETDQRLRMGEFGIQPRLVKPPEAEREEASQGDLGATMVYSATRAAASRRSRRLEAGRACAADADGKTFVLDRPRAVVGRSRRCDFVLEDPNMSRRHFELQLRGDGLVRGRPGVDQRHRRQRPARAVGASLQPGDEIVAGTSQHAVRRGLRSDRLSDPIEVLLQFAFLGVLYLFLLWVARSALRDLRRPATEPSGFGGDGARRGRAAVLAAGWSSSGAAACQRATRSGSGRAS